MNLNNFLSQIFYILKFFSWNLRWNVGPYQQMQQLCKGNLGPSALTVLRLGGAHLGGYGEAPDSAWAGTWHGINGSTVNRNTLGIWWNLNELDICIWRSLCFLLHFLHDMTRWHQPKGHDSGARSFLWRQPLDFGLKPFASGWHRLFLPTADWTSDLGESSALGAARAKVQGVTSRQESRFAQGWQGLCGANLSTTNSKKKISTWNIGKHQY